MIAALACRIVRNAARRPSSNYASTSMDVKMGFETNRGVTIDDADSGVSGQLHRTVSPLSAGLGSGRPARKPV
jgi:hypothetical protein